MGGLQNSGLRITRSPPAILVVTAVESAWCLQSFLQLEGINQSLAGMQGGL